MGYTIPQFGSLNIVDATPENGWATEATFDSSKNSLISLQTNAGNIFNLGCELKDTYTGNDYENTGTVANPVWSLVQNTAGAPVAPASSLQYNKAGQFGGSTAIYTLGTHPTQDTFTFGTVTDNATVICVADNASSFRLSGLDFTGTPVRSYSGVFYNNQFDSIGLGIKKTRVIHGSNEDMDIEIQGSHAVLISATDDAFGDGFAKIAANAQVDIHPYTSGDTIGEYSLSISRVSEANFGAANTSEVVIRSRGNGAMLPSGNLHLNLGVTDGGVGIVAMTTVQKDAITSLYEGLIVYDTTLHKLCVYTAQAGGSSTGWETITSVLE